MAQNSRSMHEGVAEDGGEPGRLEQRQPVGGEAHLRDKAMW